MQKQIQNMSTQKDFEAFVKAIEQTVKEFIAHEEDYSDDVQLQIRTSDLSLEIADPENDIPGCDYYPVMDLVMMSAAEPGKWEPDREAIESVAAEYIVD